MRGEEGSLFRLTIELEATQRGNGVAEVAENEDCVTERREMAREAAAQAQVATDGLDAGAEFFLAHFRTQVLKEDVASGEGAFVFVLCGR